MLKADRLPPTTSSPFWRPERKAWAVMLGAFAIFCLLTSTMVVAGYRWIAGPKASPILARVVDLGAANLQRAGHIRQEMLVDNTPLAPGDRVSIAADDSGAVATRLNLGGGSVALWPDTSVLVESNSLGAHRLRLESGQAVIDLPASAESVQFVTTGITEEIELTAPGRYRVRELALEGTTTAIAERQLVPAVEVATDRGLARVGEIEIEPGFRLLTSGAPQVLPNRWSLLRDGDFSAWTEAEYRAWLSDDPNARRSETWYVDRQALVEDAISRNGLFFLRQDCDEGGAKQQACRNVVRLARLGGNTKDSTTSIIQEVTANVAAYRSVVLEADVRIDAQSLSKGGADGSECPLFALVLYSNGTRSDLRQDFCFWAYTHQDEGEISAQPWIHSRQIAPKTWYLFSDDLKARIPDLRVIQQIIFFSNGHDYDASVADVSLWAEGLGDTLEP